MRRCLPSVIGVVGIAAVCAIGASDAACCQKTIWRMASTTTPIC